MYIYQNVENYTKFWLYKVKSAHVRFIKSFYSIQTSSYVGELYFSQFYYHLLSYAIHTQGATIMVTLLFNKIYTRIYKL